MKTLKSVRLDNNLIFRIEAISEKERRSFSNQVECLLEKAVDDVLLPTVTLPEKSTTPAKRFVPPTVEEVRDHITNKGYTFDAAAFIAHYESNGWKVGRNKMKSWKAACTTWSKQTKIGVANGKSKSAYQQRVESGDERSFNIPTDF